MKEVHSDTLGQGFEQCSSAEDVGERETTRFRSQKTGALLGYLAYHLERTHPRGMLMDILWGGDHPRAELLRLTPCPRYGGRTYPHGGRG